MQSKVAPEKHVDSLRDEYRHFDQVVMGRVHWEVQGMNGSLQSRLKVNPNQVTTKSFDVYLNERPNVTLNKLLAESSIITPNSTGRGKDGVRTPGQKNQDNGNC